MFFVYRFYIDRLNFYRECFNFVKIPDTDIIKLFYNTDDIVSRLPLIDNTLGESGFVGHGYYRAVVEYRLAVKLSEHLMLIGRQH